jgi:transposase-like protein
MWRCSTTGARDLASIAAELGIAVAPSTILRWVIRYTGEFVRRWAPFEMVIGRSWRADETYIKVNGGWMFLYRAVDEKGRTVASYLSRTRDQTAARLFFRQALNVMESRVASRSMASSQVIVRSGEWVYEATSTSSVQIP